MKFKLDENVPVDLVRVLADIGHDVDTVPQEAPIPGPTPVPPAVAPEKAA